ncbi:hypothetical protein HIM_07191 [Hirsutella minnesotensis 3608]|uniref:Uncharacterized protein n=1 Tax=Hirsutella minnesotensis 3608 TaxID=1043627 RepID=A0A0F7ZZ08_9HYPO|nr:hypothetical protein HIM_07191 [Hirsutella minnesotensis 3608]
MSSLIEPFRIEVPDSAIQRLKDKLSLSTFPDEVDFSDDWNYGAPRADVKRLAAHWRDGFDWRAQEAKLNELPHYKTKIPVDGFGELNIHFLHKKSSKPGSIPLLFCHGCELHPDGPSFHVVAPSMPNFGFSDGVTKRGFSIPQYAETMHKVMLALGYDKYVTQGGDWGFIVTRLMAVQYPKHCLATHVNFIRPIGPPAMSKSPILYLQHAVLPYSNLERRGLGRSAWFREEGFGYNLEQSTKPSTLGFGLADSPLALLAWVYEKLHDWTDAYPWNDDEILTWISIYQFSNAGPAASVRIYYESKHTLTDQTARGLAYVPKVLLGYSVFPQDVFVPPRRWARAMGPVAFERYHDKGGHFAAHEKPEELAADLREMFGEKGGAAAVSRVFANKDSRL